MWFTLLPFPLPVISPLNLNKVNGPERANVTENMWACSRLQNKLYCFKMGKTSTSNQLVIYKFMLLCQRLWSYFFCILVGHQSFIKTQNMEGKSFKSSRNDADKRRIFAFDERIQPKKDFIGYISLHSVQAWGKKVNVWTLKNIKITKKKKKSAW